MRIIGGIISGLLTAAIALVAFGILAFVIGGTECDRGECNAFGEFFDEHSTVIWITCLALAAVLGAVVARAFARR